ncbi:MAG: sulfatase-like hydrolase/transferase [Thermoanaerobaculia bacterium]
MPPVRPLLLLAPFVAVLACSCRGEPRVREGPPQNLLIVVVDTLRFDRGRGGNEDRDAALPVVLRDRGRHFARALSAGIHTKPSMMALFTGFYPSESGLTVNGAKVLRPPGPMLAERLKAAGFATAAVVSNPNLVGQGLGFERGFDEFDARMTGTEPNRPTGTRTAAETTAAALERLSQLTRSKKRWFLWVHYLEPHGPYRPPAAFLRIPRDPGAALPVAAEDFAPRGTIPPYQVLPECRGRNDYIDRYRGYSDYSLSEADRLLRTAGSRLRDTVVVFTSDHGEYLGEQNYWFQHSMRIDPVLFHVPFVVARSWREPRTEESRFVGQLDLVSTLTAQLGLEEAKTRGENLFSLPASRRHPLFVEYLALPGFVEVGVQLGDSVIVESNREPPERFQASGAVWTARKPNEQELRQARDAVRPHLARIRNTPAETHQLTPEEIRVLRSLGYVGGS